jgi:uncharacterized caspase-like protein
MKRLAGIFVCFVVVLTLCGPALAAKRVALVIGNSAYTHVPTLLNPKNDASDVTAALKRLGFQVISGTDLDKRAMSGLIRKFSSALADAETALFYYAGHGLQVNGKNYLAPVNARLNTEADLDFDMIDLTLILRQMERQQSTNLVFLDACRDNPLLKNLARSMGATRSATLSRGLARVSSGLGTMISYATAPDAVALDGKGRNSPYTTALLRHIERPGIDVANMMISVRQDVVKATRAKQVPWEYSSLTGRFYFKPGQLATPGPAPAPRPAPPPATGPDEAERAWGLIKDTKEKSVLRAYIKRYSTSFYATVARARLARLQQAAKPTPAPAPRPAPPPAAREMTPELLFWDRVKYSNNYNLIRDYILKYPNGTYVRDARQRLVALGRRTALPPPHRLPPGKRGFTRWQTAKGYQNTFNRLTKRGLYPKVVHGHSIDGVRIFRARFVKVPRGRFLFWTHHGISRKQYRAADLKLRPQGYKVIHYNTVTDEWGSFIQVVWIKR